MKYNKEDTNRLNCVLFEKYEFLVYSYVNSKEFRRFVPKNHVWGELFCYKSNSSCFIYIYIHLQFGHPEPPWSLDENFAGHPVCGKMLVI